MIVLTLDRQSFLVCKWWIVTREWRARKTHDCHKGDQNQNMIYIGGTDSARMTNIWNDKLQKVNSVVMHDRCKMRFDISHKGWKRKRGPEGVAGGQQLRSQKMISHFTWNEKFSSKRYRTVRWSSTKDEFTRDTGVSHRKLVIKENHMTYTWDHLISKTEELTENQFWSKPSVDYPFSGQK